MSPEADQDLTPGELRLVEIYDDLAEALGEHEDTLPPYAGRNAIKALAALWQVANGAGERPGQIYHLGA